MLRILHTFTRDNLKHQTTIAAHQNKGPVSFNLINIFGKKQKLSGLKLNKSLKYKTKIKSLSISI